MYTVYKCNYVQSLKQHDYNNRLLLRNFDLIVSCRLILFEPSKEQNVQQVSF